MVVSSSFWGEGEESSNSSSLFAGMGDRRPTLLTVEALEEVLGRTKSSCENGESESSKITDGFSESTEELVLSALGDVDLGRFFPNLSCSGLLSSSVLLFFDLLPRFLSVLVLESKELDRLLVDFPGFASAFTIHQELLPLFSFCTRTNRLCNERLCRMEFCNKENQ